MKPGENEAATAEKEFQSFAARHPNFDSECLCLGGRCGYFGVQHLVEVARGNDDARFTKPFKRIDIQVRASSHSLRAFDNQEGLTELDRLACEAIPKRIIGIRRSF